jgi:hypothetical protein
MFCESLNDCWWVGVSKTKRRHFPKADESEHVGEKKIPHIYHRYRSSAVGLTCCAGSVKFTSLLSFGYFELSKRH